MPVSSDSTSSLRRRLAGAVERVPGGRLLTDAGRGAALGLFRTRDALKGAWYRRPALYARLHPEALIGSLAQARLRLRGQDAPGFADMADQPDSALLPPLDRPGVDPAGLTERQAAWWRDGAVVLPGLLPEGLIDAYVARRAKLASAGGWGVGAPYLHVPELAALALYPPVMAAMAEVLGETLMLHLSLTGWVSTERDWHQDDYLNPTHVRSWYCAAWMALDDIHPDSGPFEYIPGSHRWPLLRGHKVRRYLTVEERMRREGPEQRNQWPKYSERYVAPAIEAEIAARGIAPVQFIARRGDVLLWHGRLMHRGTLAKQPGMMRRALINHYSGVNHRPDMARRGEDANGMVFARFDHGLA